MPLLTHLSPALKLNLSVTINEGELKKAIAFVDLSKEVINAYSSLDNFDEKTWISLHLVKTHSPDLFPFVIQKITALLNLDLSSTNALQAMLFLLGHLSREEAINPEWITAIFDSKDPWAYFALLSHHNFSVDENIIREHRSEIDAALKRATCVQYMGEKGELKFNSLLWVFVRSTNISSERKEKLVLNIAEFSFDKDDIHQWPIEVQATLVTLSNDINADHADALSFRAALFRNYILNVPIDLSSEQQAEINERSIKKKWNGEQKKNAELTHLQSAYFVIIDKLLGVFAVPKVFDAIESKLDLAERLNTILMLEIVSADESQFNVANRFLGGFFQTIWGVKYDSPRTISNDSCLFLMHLEVFKKYFASPLPEKGIGRVARHFEAMLQSADVFFIENFFNQHGYYTEGKITWGSFQNNYYAAIIVAITLCGKPAQQFLLDPVESILTLAYIFEFKRTAQDLHEMLITAPVNSEIFIKALIQHFAPLLIAAMNNKSEAQKEIEYKRIRRTADLVKLLPIDKQIELYKNRTYILFMLHNRSEKYVRQQEKRVYLGLGRDSKKEVKMKLLNWLICNLEAIERDELPCPMKTAYDKFGPDALWVNDINRVDQWLRNVILQNSPRAQAILHGLGMFSTVVEQGKKGSKMAETLMLFSAVLLEKIFKGTHITVLEIYNAAFPGRKCTTIEAYAEARASMMNEIVRRDMFDSHDDESSVGANLTSDEINPLMGDASEHSRLSTGSVKRESGGWSYSPLRIRDS